MALAFIHVIAIHRELLYSAQTTEVIFFKPPPPKTKNLGIDTPAWRSLATSSQAQDYVVTYTSVQFTGNFS